MDTHQKTEEPTAATEGSSYSQYSIHGESVKNTSEPVPCQSSGKQEAALRLLECGFSIIPVKKDKSPAIPSWTEYQEQPMPADQIHHLFSKGGVNNEKTAL